MDEIPGTFEMPRRPFITFTREDMRTMLSGLSRYLFPNPRPIWERLRPVLHGRKMKRRHFKKAVKKIMPGAGNG